MEFTNTMHVYFVVLMSQIMLALISFEWWMQKNIIYKYWRSVKAFYVNAGYNPF